MSDETKRPVDRSILVIAWAQFLVAITVVEKGHMRNLQGAWAEIVKTLNPIKWDWTKFGGVALALNIVALCFLSVSFVRSQYPLKMQTKEEMQVQEKLNDELSGIGGLVWSFSFYLFVAYLNIVFLAYVFASLTICMLILMYYPMLMRNRRSKLPPKG